MAQNRSSIVVVICCWLVLAPPAHALDHIALVVDRSNSIDRSELALQREAYIEVLRDSHIASLLEDTAIAIIEFDTDAQVVVPWTTARDAADRYELWDPGGLRGGTAIGRALAVALDLLKEKSGRRIVDVSGDGRENRDLRLLRRMRRDAISSGVEINGLVIPNRRNAAIDDYYRKEVANGFVLTVKSDSDFYTSLYRKLVREIARLGPAPGAAGRGVRSGN